MNVERQSISGGSARAGDGRLSPDSWQSMDPETRRARAEQACRTRDRDALHTLLRAYLAQHYGETRPLSPHTLRTYLQGLDILLSRWQGDTLINPSPQQVSAFVRALESSGARPSTVKVRLAGARALYRALRWAGLIDSDPTAGVHVMARASDESHPRESYTVEELERLLSDADPVDRALILLAADESLSVSECVGLRWSDVDLDNDRLAVPTRSGRERLVLAISPRLSTALRDLPRRRGDQVLGFTSDVRARQRIQGLCARTGVPYKGVQALRQGKQLRSDQSHSGTIGARKRALAYAVNARGIERRQGERRRGDRRFSERRGPDRRSSETDGAGGAEAGTDGRLPDHTAAERELARVTAESERTGKQFALLHVNLPDIPSLAEQFGPAMAQAVVTTCAERINRVRRPYDFLGRGLEHTFSLIVKNVESDEDLRRITERVQSAISTHPFVIEGQTMVLSATVLTARGVDGETELTQTEDHSGDPSSSPAVPAPE